MAALPIDVHALGTHNQCFKNFFKKAVALFDDRSLHIMGGHRQGRKQNTQKPICLSRGLAKRRGKLVGQ